METFEKIEQYLKGELKGEELQKFEEMMQADSGFSEEVEAAGFTDQVVIGAGFDKLREKMSRDIESIDRQNKNKGKWFTAGGFLVLILSGISYFMVPSVKETQPSLVQKTKTPVTTEITEIPVAEVNEDKTTGTYEKVENINSVMPAEKGNTSIVADKQVNPSEINTESESAKASNIQINKDINQMVEKVPAEIKKCLVIFHAASAPACHGNKDGSISVDLQSVKGAEPPYTFELSGSGETSRTGSFEGLNSGTYQISITDKVGCKSTEDVLVGEKNCISKKSYSINPDYSEIWKHDSEQGLSGRFAIYNKAGIIIFKGNFGQGQNPEWNGSDLNGNSTDAGIYIAIIQYDGGKTENVQITVVR